MSAFARSRTSFAGLPSLPSLSAYPLRNWKEAAASSKVPGLPALGIRLADLALRLQVCDRTTNSGICLSTKIPFHVFFLLGLLPIDNSRQIWRSRGTFPLFTFAYSAVGG